MPTDVAALESEALGKPVTVVWRDQKFKVAPANEWLLRTMHHLERGTITQGLELMLGEKQYQRFMFDTEPAPSLVDAQQLVTQILSKFGVDQGE